MTPFFNHVAWIVDDQDAAVAFLEKHFECEAGPKAVIDGPWADELAQMKNVRVIYQGVASPGTQSRIAVLRFETPPPLQNNSVGVLNMKGFRHIGFMVDDIDGKTAELKAAGYQFFGDIVTAPGFDSRTVYFYGPEGVIMQLSQSTKSS